MKLETLTCFAVEIPVRGGSYAMSRNRVLRSFSSTVVQVMAEDGTSGFGEACTLGGNYLDGFPGSAQAAIRELAPFVLQCDPLEPNVLADGMDALLIGHLPGKAAIDIATWDLRGKLLGLPAARLLGGVKQQSFGAFQAISLGSPAGMAGEVTQMADLGFRRWQLKLGDDPWEPPGRSAPSPTCCQQTQRCHGGTRPARRHHRPAQLSRHRLLHRRPHALLLPESRADTVRPPIR